jgi:hypothetical protein
VQEITYMPSLLRVSIPALLVGSALVLGQLNSPLGAQTLDPKAGGDAGKSAGDPKDSSPKKIPLDKFSMPAGGVVVLVEEAKDLRSFFPRMVILTPEKYQDLMERIDKLEKQLKVERKTPHACKLTGTVEGDTVRVLAELHFQIEQPHTSVLAGFRGAQLSDAKIRSTGGDAAWQPAVIDVGPEGYQVQVDKAGDYQLIVELRVPLASSNPGTPSPGAERSFDLALPSAAVTTLTLDLPESVKELRWNKTNVEKPLRPIAELKHWEVAVGKVAQLQVAWKEPLAPGGTTPLRTVRGQVTVRVDETQVVTTAELTLTDLRAKTKEWRLWVPLQAKIKVIPPEGVAVKQSTPNAFTMLHILTLSAPTSDPIKATVTVTTFRAANAKIPVGPFTVQDAQRQEGTIEVKLPQDARRSLHLTCYPASSLEERELPRDQPGSDIVAVYKYWEMPAPPTKGAAAAAKVLPPSLEIERRTMQGKVEMHLEHNLKLHEAERGSQIVATCKIVARPEGLVDYLDLQLPHVPVEAWPLVVEPSAAGFPGAVPWSAWGLASQLPIDGEWVLASSSAAVELQYPDDEAKSQRKVRVKWHPTQSKEIAVTLVGTYTLPAGMQKIRLELPRPVAPIRDRGAKAQMEVGDMLELLTQDGGPELPVPLKHLLTRTWERAPTYWNLAWRAYRPDFPVNAITDVTFRQRHAQVKQQMLWDQADRPRGSTLLKLRVPQEAKGLKVSAGGKLAAQDREKHLAWVDTGEVAGKSRIVLEYDFALPVRAEGKNEGPQVGVPLIWPEQATHVSSKVRLWSLPGQQPSVVESSLAELTWKDAGIEDVPGQDRLPVRVLVSEGQNVSLNLRLQAAQALLPTAVIDRALLQVSVNDEGTEGYRARFLLAKLHAATLEVRMPVPLSSLAPQFLVDGKAVDWQQLDSAGLVARLNIDPSLYGKSVILEVDYQLPRGLPTKEGLWHTTLNAPLLDGEVFLGKVRWQVVLPPAMFAVSARGDATTEHCWMWRGWLPSLEPAITGNDLELWLTGQDLTEPSPEASLVSSRSSLEPLQVFRVNRALWFFVCSGIVMLIGLSLWLYRPGAPGWFAAVLIFLAAIAGAGWIWPAALSAALYGAAPGFVVMAVLFALQWLLHEHYRRRLLFMPGFTRVKDGSSLVRTNSTPRIREQPSTIDAPLPLESSNTGFNQ